MMEMLMSVEHNTGKITSDIVRGNSSGNPVISKRMLCSVFDALHTPTRQFI